MIPLRKFHSVATFVLLMAPVFFVTGCASLNDSPSSPQHANSLSSDEPGSARLIRYCRRMAETNNLRIAIGVCQRALEADPSNPQPVLILAKAYTAAGQRKEAREAYEFALMIDGTNSDAHFGLGKLYLQDLDYPAALPHLTAALESGKSEPSVFNAIGILHDQLGRHDEAQAFYRSGLDIEPGNTALANNLGVSLVLSRNLEEGVSILGALRTRQNPNLTSYSNHETAQAAINDISQPLETELQTSSLVNQTRDRAPASTPASTRARIQQPNSGNTASVPNGSANVRTVGFYIPKHTRAPGTFDSEPVVTGMGTASNTASSPYFDNPVLDAVSQSQGSELVDLVPEVPAVPVEIVAFQAPPPLPKGTLVSESSMKPTTTVFSVETEPGQRNEATRVFADSALGETENSRDFRTQTRSSVYYASSDPITIIPRRKPAVASEFVTPSGSFFAAVDYPSSSAPPADQALYANIPHLPIEMPGFEPASEPMEAQETAQTNHPLTGVPDHRPTIAGHQSTDRPGKKVLAVQTREPGTQTERSSQAPAAENATISLETNTSEQPDTIELLHIPTTDGPMMADTPDLQRALQIATLSIVNPSGQVQKAGSQYRWESARPAPPASAPSQLAARSYPETDGNRYTPVWQVRFANRHEPESGNPQTPQRKKLLAMMMLRSPPNATV